MKPPEGQTLRPGEAIVIDPDADEPRVFVVSRIDADGTVWVSEQFIHHVGPDVRLADVSVAAPGDVQWPRPEGP
jgi:hypothetical protein